MLKWLSIILLLLVSSSVYPADLCGPSSLQHCLAAIGVPVDIKTFAGIVNHHGASMKDLVATAQKQGIQATAVKARLNELTTPAILHLWSQHYIVYEAPGKFWSEGEYLKDAPQDYSGFAIVFGQLPDNKSIRFPDLRLDRYIVDIGSLTQGEKKNAEVTLTNTGTEKLVLLDTKVSCSCLSMDLIPGTEVPIGEKIAVTVHFDSESQYGEQNKQLTIICTDPVSPTVVLTVIGNVGPRTPPPGLLD